MDRIIDWYVYSSPAIFFVASIYISYRLGKFHRNILEEAYNITYKTETQRFLELFDTDTYADKDININIHPDLYCYEKWQKMIEETNEEEQKWKNRVLFHHTPQGNIMMWYDLYKHAFTYLSDTNISYMWLNECAMKYVRTYYCRDFFVDTQVLPLEHENPFNTMKIDEEKKEKEKKQEKKNALNLDLNSDVFMKKKKPQTQTKPVLENKEQTPITKQKFINNFRHIGKIQNHSILQKYPIPKKRQSNIATMNLSPQESPKEPIAKDYQYIEFKKQKKEENSNFFESFFI